jgi:hypothetical protein
LSQFKEWFRKELEDRLTRLPDLGYEDEVPDRINIAMLTFAFDNAEVISMLRERGEYIKKEEYEKMRKVDGEINDYVQNNITKIARPVTAFITFENEEGFNRCAEYNETVDQDPEYADIREFLGFRLEFKEASEPTDIIWENRHLTRQIRAKRTFYVVLLTFFSLCVSFVVVFMVDFVGENTVYPYADCYSIYSMYGVYKDGAEDYTELAYYAIEGF